MKKYIFVLSFLLFAASWVGAQNNNGWNNGNGFGSVTGSSTSLNPNNYPSYVQNWLNTGGPIPFPMAIGAMRLSRHWARQNYGLSMGQMIQQYYQGDLTIDHIPTVPVGLLFRVSYGGGSVVVDLDDIF